MNGLVEIGQYPDPLLADIVRGRLAAEGIDAVVLGGAVASLGLGALAPATLIVASADEARARAIATGSCL